MSPRPAAARVSPIATLRSRTALMVPPGIVRAPRSMSWTSGSGRSPRRLDEVSTRSSDLRAQNLAGVVLLDRGRGRRRCPRPRAGHRRRTGRRGSDERCAGPAGSRRGCGRSHDDVEGAVARHDLEAPRVAHGRPRARRARGPPVHRSIPRRPARRRRCWRCGLRGVAGGLSCDRAASRSRCGPRDSVQSPTTRMPVLRAGMSPKRTHSPPRSRTSVRQAPAERIVGVDHGEGRDAAPVPVETGRACSRRSEPSSHAGGGGPASGW